MSLHPSIDVAVEVRRTLCWDERINPTGTLIVMRIDEAYSLLAHGFVRITGHDPSQVLPLFVQHQQLGQRTSLRAR